MNTGKLLFSLLIALCSYCTTFGGGRGDELRVQRRAWLKSSDTRRHAPSYVSLQYAGGMGFLSAGAGWQYGKKCQWETEILTGFVPEKYMDRTHLTFTLKQHYTPWSVSCVRPLAWDPIYFGLYLNSITGESFWPRCPERYPKGYYWFSTKFHFSLFVGGRVRYDIFPPEAKSFCKSATLFYEVHACDMYIISAATNRYLKPSDLISLSFGVRIEI